MKKLLYLLLLLLVPLVVSAADNDIQIKSVELIEKSENTVELEEAKFEGLDVSFNLKFFELNDSAKYKITIVNVSDKKYKLHKDEIVFSDETYVSYEVKYEEGIEDLNKGDEIEVLVSVVYDNEVSEGDYIQNVYKNQNKMSLSFEHGVENPNTSVGKLFIFYLITVSAIVLIVYFARKMKFMYSLVLLLMLVPFIAKAVNMYVVTINAYIEIERKIPMGTFTLCGKGPYDFEIGMTFEEWLESNYNVDGLSELSGSALGYFAGPCDFYLNSLLIDTYSIIEDKAEYRCNCYTVAECVSPNSKISIGLDGETKLAKDVKVDDYILYYDFVNKEVRLGKVKKTYVHKDATSFVRYTFEDGTKLEATDYHPIYTSKGWKSYTNRNGYETPVVGDLVKTKDGYKKLVKIEAYTGKEDFVDFEVVSLEGKQVDNYFADGTLVHSAY